MLSLSSNIKKAMLSKTKSLGSAFNFILPERYRAQHTEFGKPTRSITTHHRKEQHLHIKARIPVLPVLGAAVAACLWTTSKDN